MFLCQEVLCFERIPGGFRAWGKGGKVGLGGRDVWGDSRRTCALTEFQGDPEQGGGGGGRLGGRVSRKTHALKEFQGVSGHGRGEFCTSSPFVVVHA